MSETVERRCPKARKRTGRKAKPRVPHLPHDWWAGRYLPVGDVGFPAHCPGWREPAPDTSSASDTRSATEKDS